MAKSTTVYLISGRTGAGKTTLANWLAEALPAYRISHDEWLRTAYGPDLEADQLPLCCQRLNALIWKQVQAISQLRIDIALEGWGGRKLRDAARKELKRMEINHQFIYVDCPEKIRWERVKSRNHELGDIGFSITRQAFSRMEQLDEPFDEDEACVIIQNTGNTQQFFRNIHEAGVLVKPRLSSERA